MSKVTIKFWHEESKSYQDENDGEGDWWLIRI